MEKSCQIGDVIRSQRFIQGKIGKLHSMIVVGEHGDADDPTRGTAKFVVIDVLHDGFDVKARRLNVDDVYDPKGETICFVQRKCRIAPLIRPSDVEHLGQMEQTFVWPAAAE